MIRARPNRRSSPAASSLPPQQHPGPPPGPACCGGDDAGNGGVCTARVADLVAGRTHVPRCGRPRPHRQGARGTAPHAHQGHGVRCRHMDQRERFNDTGSDRRRSRIGEPHVVAPVASPPRPHGRGVGDHEMRIGAEHRQRIDRALVPAVRHPDTHSDDVARSREGRLPDRCRL